MRVLGVDGCKGGWVGVVLEDDAAPVALVERSIDRLSDAAGPVDAIGIDMPIHLNEDADRVCDSAARQLIRPFTSRVFNAPVLCVLDCETYLDACAASFAALGKKISKQTWALVPKIREVEQWRTSAGCAVYEVHPEAAFAAMAGRVIAARKRTPEGAQVRRAWLDAQGLAPPERPAGVGVDDLLDACAAAWSTRRLARGEGRSLPDPPVIVRGQPQAIWY
jgi:predicted RNase H-like nuclease